MFTVNIVQIKTKINTFSVSISELSSAFQRTQDSLCHLPKPP